MKHLPRLTLTLRIPLYSRLPPMLTWPGPLTPTHARVCNPQALQHVNARLRDLYPEEHELFDIVLMTNNHAQVGVRLINSVNHYGKSNKYRVGAELAALQEREGGPPDPAHCGPTKAGGSLIPTPPPPARGGGMFICLCQNKKGPCSFLTLGPKLGT